MEELLMLAGYHSDTDSIRSSTVNIEAIKVRKRSGRKQQAPRRAAFDSDYVLASTEQRQQGHQAVAHEQATAESAFEESPAGTSLPAVPAADPAAQQVIGRPASAPSARGKKGKQDLAGPCCHCNATNSPQWRKGPKGKPVLCNACGIRFLRNRTLTKVVPKKRRAGTAAPREAAPPVTAATAAGAPKAKRVKAEATLQEDDDLDLATDEVLVTDDTLVATDDSIEEAHSGSDHPALTHVDPTAAAAAPAVDLSMLTAHPQQWAVNSGGSSSSGYELHGSPIKCSSSGVQQLAAGSTHLLLGVNSCVSHNPSLSLALALHQKQHQDEPSPKSAAYGSPMSNASAYMHSDNVLGSPPASPLVLGDTSGVSNMLMAQQQQVPSLWMSPLQQQQKFVTDVSSQLLPEPAPLSLMGSTATAAAAAPGQQGPLDILQLVQQISSVLGGVGPAVEFIKAMQTGGAAAVAAAAAAAVGLRQ